MANTLATHTSWEAPTSSKDTCSTPLLLVVGLAVLLNAYSSIPSGNAAEEMMQRMVERKKKIGKKMRQLFALAESIWGNIDDLAADLGYDRKRRRSSAHLAQTRREALLPMRHQQAA